MRMLSDNPLRHPENQAMPTPLAARVLFACFLVCSLAHAAAAQAPGPGLSWTGTSGSSVRSFIPSCTNLPVAAVRGETVGLRVWGDQRAPFVLLAAGSATQCLPFPGFGNALILDQPLVLLGAGVLTQISPCLSCPPGYEEMQFVIPLTLPSRASLSLQAVSYGVGRVAFTVAITGTVL